MERYRSRVLRGLDPTGEGGRFAEPSGDSVIALGRLERPLDGR
jgi:hypothetical protein